MLSVIICWYLLSIKQQEVIANFTSFIECERYRREHNLPYKDFKCTQDSKCTGEWK